MKKKISPLMKDTLRTIKHTLARFLAIIAMTGLSAIVFVGLQACIPNLRETIVKRVKDNQIHDLRIHSYAGIRDKDKKILKDLSGSNKIEYMSFDTFDVKDDEYSINLMTLTKDIDTPIVTKGKIPNKKNEILLDDLHREKYGDKIGEKIVFINKKNNEDENILNTEEFIIVGYGKSLDYIGDSRSGSTSTGDFFAIVNKESLNKEYPDYALLRLERNKDKDISTKKFKLFEADNLKEIKKEFESRPEEVKKEILKDAYEKIDDGKRKISDGKKEISDGQKKLDDSKEELDQAKIDLDKGEAELKDSKSLLDDTKIKLDDAKNELDENEKILINSKTQLDDGYNQLKNSKSQLDSSKAELDQAKEKLDKGYKELEDNEKLYQEKIKEGEEKLKQAKIDYEEGKKKLEQSKKEYQIGLKEYEEKISKAQEELDINKDKLNQAKEELDKNLSEFNSKLKEINQNISELKDAINQIESSIDQIKTQIPEGITREIAQKENLTEILSLYEKIDQLEQEKAKLHPKLQGLYTAKDLILAKKPILDKAQEEYEQGLESYNQGLAQFEKEKEEGKNKLDQAKIQIYQGQKKLDESKVLIETGPQKLEEEKKAGLKKLEKGRKDLQIAQEKYDKGLEQYQNGLSEYQDAKNTLDQKYAEYEQGLSKFNQGKKDYESGLKDYQEGLDKYDKGRKDLQKGRDDYEKGLKEYEDGLKTFKSEKEKAEKDIKKAEKDIQEIEKELEDIKIPSYKIEGIYSNQAFNGFISQVSSLNYMSLIFTAMFYLVAILVTLTTILRMVETERTQIGTLKALGYSRIKILGKFLLYGLLAAFLGSILGSVIGQFVLMPPIVNAYISATNLELITHKINYINPLIILLISCLIVGATVFFTILNSLKEQPANLMRPKPPTEAKRTIFERIPVLWNKLSFLNKVSIRNVVRHKLRVFMIIIGVAGSFALIAMAFGIQNSVRNVGPKQFGQVYKYQAQIVYDDKKSDFEKLNERLSKYLNDKIDIISEEGSIITEDGLEQDINIIATDDTDKFLDFVELRQRGSKKNYSLEDDKVIINEKLAMILNLSKKDKLKFIDADGLEHSLEVQDITEQYFNHVVYMTKETYQKTINPKQENNSFLLKFRDESDKNISHVKTELSKYESNLLFIPVKDLKVALESLSDSLNIVILMIIVVSALLTFVVLYNLTNINISERFREIATIKVLGFRPKEVASYIFKENYILTVVGILFGIGLAKAMHSIIVFSLSSGTFLFDPAMNLTSFIWAAIAVIFFMGLVMLLAKREMDRIDMVEALKDF